jgi:hypothetical protein
MYQILKTDNYLLIVDKTEVKVGDTVYYTIYGEDEDGNIDKEPFEVDISTVREINSLNNIELTETSLIALPSECKKIIAHLPLNNSLILEGVDLLPPLEDEADVLALNYANSKSYMSIFHADDFNDFKNGYNKAKETYKYTEEDMIKAFEYGKTLEPFDSFEDFIQYLQQPKLPVAFLRTDVNDSKWVGKYIY